MQTPVSVSVLFTDLVGSTELSSRLGASDAESLRHLHFALLRDAIQRCGGREVKNLGDGLMASFPGVGAALDAAIAMQQAIDQHNRSGGEPLGVRIGVATGDAVEDDGDLFGEPVVQAARLCAAADGGAILAPEVVRLLAPRGAHDFRSVGDLDLKGLPDPVPTVEVVWEPIDDAPHETIPIQGRLTVAHIAGFVGRQRERNVLEDAHKATASGERRAVLVAGEAGMGKTRLVTEVAHSAHEAGAVVLYGRCDEDLSIPYQPWVEVLSHYLTHASDEALARHDPVRLAELARLVPDLRRRIPELAAPVQSAAATERHLLFAAVTSLLADVAAASGCLVLVLDDLHWGDQTTVQLLRHVVATVDIGPVLVLGTYRDTDLGADDPMTDALAALHREPGVDIVPLHGLGDVEIVDLLESIAGHELEDDGVALAHAVQNETDGNPFFVGEVLRHLAETGAIALGPDGRWGAAADLTDVGLPASVRAVVGQRVRRLGDVAHQVLATAAVVGRDFDVDVVVVASRLDEEEVLDALEAATAAGLVGEAPDRPDRFTFIHALVQHILYEEQAGGRRVRLHHRVAEALEAMLGSDPGDRVGELANHWLAATRPADLDKAVEYAGLAGDRAMAALAHDEAARWYQLALDALDHRPHHDDRRRCELLLALAEAEGALRSGGGRDRLVEAARLAQGVGATDLMVAALLAGGGHVRLNEVDEEFVALVDDALELIGTGDSPARAGLLSARGSHLQWIDVDGALPFVEEAIAVARRTGDPSAVYTAILRSRFSWNRPGQWTDGLRRADEALDHAERKGDWAAIADLASSRVTVALGLADLEAAVASRALAASAADRTGVIVHRWWAAVVDGLLELLRGEPDAAELLAEQAIALPSTADNVAVYGAQLFGIRWHQGRLGELVDLAEQVAAENPGVPSFGTVVPWANAYAGKLERTRELLAELRRSGFRLPTDGSWLTGTVLLSEAASLAGDVEEAELRYADLLPWQQAISCSSVTCEGPVANVLGILAETLGRPDDAVAHQEVALRLAERLAAPFHIARALLALGRLRGDRTQIEAALAIAQRHGYRGVEADAEATLRSVVTEG